MLPAVWVLVVVSFLAAGAGTLGGLGGALFLVPVLILLGVDPILAAPLGAMTVAAGSLAAAPGQLESGLVHHRLAVTLEVVASLTAIGGALLSEAVDATLLSRLLAVAALCAAALAARPTAPYNPPDPLFDHEIPGEWPGTLAGAYRLGDAMVPYAAKRLPAGLAGMAVAGLVSGIAGVGGGFIKVPVMREIMRVPLKVATATSTFTVGITASVTLLVFAGQGRLEPTDGAACVLGALGGGVVGAKVQGLLSPLLARRVIAVLLAVVAVLLWVRA